jgi:hypothetical protein
VEVSYWPIGDVPLLTMRGALHYWRDAAENPEFADAVGRPDLIGRYEVGGGAHINLSDPSELGCRQRDEEHHERPFPALTIDIDEDNEVCIMRLPRDDDSLHATIQ